MRVIAGRPGARQAVREATAQAHLRMHRPTPFTAIAGGTLSRDGYARLLGSLYRFHTSVAAAAERSQWSGLCSSRHRLKLLREDLGHFSEPIPTPAPHWHPGPGHCILGALYAAEGSAIGGRLLAQQLDYLFGASSDGRRFFAGRGKADSLAWQQLLAVLEQECTGDAARAAAIRGALAAFDLFETCVLETLPLAEAA